MKKILVLASLVAMVSVAACGGGGGGTPATPTSTDTKAVAASTVGPTIGVTDAAIKSSVIGITGAVNAMAQKMLSGELSPKEDILVNDTFDCANFGGTGGNVTANGTITCDLTGGETWTCSNFRGTVDLVFTDCGPFEGVIDGTTYQETISGNAQAIMEGGAANGFQNDVTSLIFNGSLAGTPSVTGTVDGSADLANINFQGSGVPDPTITCSGTASVTVTTDGTTETCTIDSQCETCSS